MRQRGILIMMILLLCCSCGRQRRVNAFMEHDELRLQVAGKVQFRYDELNCQLSFSRDRNEFRAQTDNTSDFYTVRLNFIPTQVEETVTADLSWTTDTDILHRKNLTLEVVRIEGDKIWLWSDSGRIGVSLRVLE